MNTQKTGRSKLISQAIQFFYDNAGFSYDPKIETQEQGRKRGAKALAKAERDAASAGITFAWDRDYVETNDEPGEFYQVVAYDTEGKVVGALGGIDDPSQGYARVIEAEIALKVLTK